MTPDSQFLRPEDIKFGPVEYVVFGIVLSLSAAIGVFYGCFGSKQKTTQEFLLADRQMSPLPVAMSLLCSFISAVTFLGNPAEIYLYGTQIGMSIFGFIPLIFTAVFFFAPVYFNLQISSAHEYLEMRFSKGMRITVSIIAIFHLITYMGIVVQGPSLALQQVTGMNTRLSAACIFLVCMFYSSLGGLKAVLWTDVLQAGIMFTSFIIIVAKGIVDEGGLGTIWSRAESADRIQFFNFDPDPRTRHTFWGAIIGTYFAWLPVYGSSQGQVQRYLSLPSFSKCKKALYINMFGLMVITFVTVLAGIAVFGKYYSCDPLQMGIVSSSDQLIPLFVMETSGNVPGLPGLFVAGLTCASLSTVSSGLSALASILIYDYVQNKYPNMKDSKLSRMSKLATFFFGLVCFSFVFVVEKMGNILPAANSLSGFIVGPTLGVFMLGMFFPWSNTKGALTGMITAFALMISFIIGSFIANEQNLLPNQQLPLSVQNCIYPWVNDTDLLDFPRSQTTSPPHWKDNQDSFLIQLLSVSYNWHVGMGTVLTLLVGLVSSFLFSRFGDDGEIKKIKPGLLSPPMLRLWRFLLPKSLNLYVEREESLK